MHATRVLCAGTILTRISITIPTQNVYSMFILCTVPIGSGDASSPIPLIRVEFDDVSLPPVSGQADINNVNTAIVQSGYLTWIAQDPAAPDHVVIGLRNGLVSTGDPWPFATPESQLIADLLASDVSLLGQDCRTGPCDDLRNFFSSNLTSFPHIGGSGGTIYRFSTATVVGTIGPSVLVAEPVPVPASIVLVGVAVLALVIQRSRQTARRLSPDPHALGKTATWGGIHPMDILMNSRRWLLLLAVAALMPSLSRAAPITASLASAQSCISGFHIVVVAGCDGPVSSADNAWTHARANWPGIPFNSYYTYGQAEAFADFGVGKLWLDIYREMNNFQGPRR